MKTSILNFILVQTQRFLGDGSGAMNGSILDRYVTRPISENLDVFSNFAFVLCALMGLLGGMRIYTRIMNGDEQVKWYAFRWLGALLAVLVIGTALQHIASSQKPLQGDANVGSFIGN